MTDTDHQPHTTTDDLTDEVAATIYAHTEATEFADWPDATARERRWALQLARALLTSGPLADRLNALTRVEALADDWGHALPGVARELYRALRGDR